MPAVIPQKQPHRFILCAMLVLVWEYKSNVHALCQLSGWGSHESGGKQLVLGASVDTRKEGVRNHSF